MTPKERVHAALKREPVDRVPIFMWYHPETIRNLAQALDVPEDCVHKLMGNDVCQAWVGNNAPMEVVVHDVDGQTHTDAWKITWVRDGPFNQIQTSPLSNTAPESWNEAAFPYEQIPELLACMEKLAADREEYFIGCDVSPCVFELVCRMRGMEATLMAMGMQSQAIEKLLTLAGNFSKTLANAACERFDLDWLWTGDDVGGQSQLMLNPSQWRAQIKPHLTEVISVGKEHGLWVAFHSCGAIRPIIPDLIKMGVDVLNPIQCNCPGMEPFELKREYGRDLAFMGGLDTQHLLPHGSALDVRSATEDLIEAMCAHGGGYILAASHTVPPETPLENVFAMLEAAGLETQAIYDHAAQLRTRSLH